MAWVLCGKAAKSTIIGIAFVWGSYSTAAGGGMTWVLCGKAAKSTRISITFKYKAN